MKKCFSILFLISLCSMSFANTAICEKEALRFGDGTGKDEIPAECSQHFLLQAGPRLKKETSDKKVSVHAYKNIIFVNNPDLKTRVQTIIAGKYTELENIQAIALDEKNQEIIVLEESGDILSFSATFLGNVAPKRIIKHKSLEHAYDIGVIEDTIVVLDDVNDSVLFFNRLGHYHYPEGKKNIGPIKAIRNVKGAELSTDSAKRLVRVKDESSKTETLYHLETGNIELIPSK